MLSRLPTRCAFCREKFSEEERASGRKLHPACIDGYADQQQEKSERKAEKAKRAKAKVERAVIKAQKQKRKSLSVFKAEAQAIRNKLVLAMAVSEGCISCGNRAASGYQAGHYRSRGSAPHLALDLRNIRKQCVRCNMHLHGNPIGYRQSLVAEHGEAWVQALESDQEPRHYSKDDYEAMKAGDRAKLKQLKEQE